MREPRAFPQEPDPDEQASPFPPAQQAGEASASSPAPGPFPGPPPDPSPEPLRIPPLLPRRNTPWLLVEVDDSAAALGALTWALREAARREAAVVAVRVLDDVHDPVLGAPVPPSPQGRVAARRLLDAQVLRAIAETGVHGRVRTAVLERVVFEALTAATQGADLVIVGAQGKTLLRQAVARPPYRRLPRGA